MVAHEAPAELVAVEIDTRAHPSLALVYNEVHTSIEPLDGRKFDCVLLLDVLEHLPDPFDFVARLAPLLAPNAFIVISVPNVAHWSVRLPLFFCGRFEYRSRGILDATHRYFFTRKRLCQLCDSIPGATSLELSVSIEPVELVIPDWVQRNPLFAFTSRIRKKIAQLIPSLMAYQHLALVQLDASPPRDKPCASDF
jgi:SAM-dependent methyltransferase